MKKICVVTGTRAEYGLLKPVIKKIIADDEMQLLLYVTGAHLASEFGSTFKEIEHDGIPISRKIDMLLTADTPSGILKSMGVEMMGFADTLAVDLPDMMILLGDRYEILVAAMAAMIYRIPIAHIHGGEVTAGAIDEAIRHSVTKMSQLHFASTEKYRKRIVQLGENPNSVFDVGALGVENAKSVSLLNKHELEKQIKFSLSGEIALVTYHPVTLENVENAKMQFLSLLRVLERKKELKIIFTKANSDLGGRIINALIDTFVSENKERCIAFESLGQLRYLSLLQFCSIVIGNSSSGIIEVPSFNLPTVNIGDRQKGRLHASSVIDCTCEYEDIDKAVTLGLSTGFLEKTKQTKNPYEKANTSDEIIKTIKIFLKKGISVKKNFYDLEN